MQEIWKPIKGYEGKYEISSLGKVKSLNYSNSKTEKLLKLVNSNGYKNINLCKNNIIKVYRLHRLLAEAFIPNHENKSQVNHINGVKSDFRLENLEWVTPKENSQHAWDTKLNKITDKHISKNKRFGKNNWNSKAVLQFSKSGIFIREWESMASVEKELGIKNECISYCCNGKTKSSGGFTWKFKKEK